MDFQLPKSLIDSISDIVIPELQEEKDYEEFFRKSLSKFGVSQPDQLSGQNKKDFYNYIDKNWKADDEEKAPDAVNEDKDGVKGELARISPKFQELKYKKGKTPAEKKQMEAIHKKMEGLRKKLKESDETLEEEVDLISTLQESGFSSKEIHAVLMENLITEAADELQKKVAAAIEGKSFMSLRAPLETIFKKKDINFVTEPIPAYFIKINNDKSLVILNKKYVNGPDIAVGDIAIGYLR